MISSSRGSPDMRGRKSKSAHICLKFGSFLFVCTVILVLANWDILTRKSKDQIKFKVFSDDGYLRIVPASNNSTKRNIYPYLGVNSSEQYDLRIIAIVYNREASLLRLLESLNRAQYSGDRVRLEVWIDRAKNGSIHKKTFDVAKAFVFKHGSYQTIPQKQHVGIYGQWLSTWKPVQNTSEIAVILEDDLTVSPYFYKYLKFVHAKYDSYPHVNGFSLQGISIKHSGNGYLQGPKDTPVFLYPVIGTWGFSPSKKNWMMFMEWFTTAYQEKDFYPLVPGNVASLWYETFMGSGRTEGMWSMWHIYNAWKQKEFTLYPNFKDHQGLTASWKDKGLHYSGLDVGASNPLLAEWKPEYEHLPDDPVKLDIKGNRV